MTISSFHDTNSVIGRRIRLLRRQWHMTQAQLAAEVDVSPGYIGEIERGHKPLSLPIAEQLCLLFGTSYDYLFRGQETGSKTNQTDSSVSTPNEPATPARDALIRFFLTCNENECQDYLVLIRDLQKLGKRREEA
jgi:transcriptional regulator with XRE-family HTH domain